MPDINLEEQIKLLVELQGLDTHILKLEKELAAIPERIKAEEEEFKKKSIGLKHLEDGLKNLQVKRKEKEVDLETKEASVKKLQIQLYQVKTNKEYTALEQEIARAHADGSIIEEDIIKMLDAIDVENKKIAQGKEALKVEEAHFAEDKKKTEGEAKNIQTELEGLTKQRSDLAAKVDDIVLKKYERLLNSKDGLAVVPVANETCQGCFRVMPPQVINEIKLKHDLIFCENCARILYIEE